MLPTKIWVDKKLKLSSKTVILSLDELFLDVDNVEMLLSLVRGCVSVCIYEIVNRQCKLLYCTSLTLSVNSAAQ